MMFFRFSLARCVSEVKTRLGGISLAHASGYIELGVCLALGHKIATRQIRFVRPETVTNAEFTDLLTIDGVASKQQ